MSVASKGFRYARTGPIASVLKLENFNAVAFDADKDVIVKMAFAPIHRSDAAVINGTALGRMNPTQATATPALRASPFPRIGGHEGVGVVVDSGRASNVKAGDLVWISPTASVGTWATHVAVSGDHVHVVPSAIGEKALPLVSCATSLITANQVMSRDFAKIKKGDAIVVNGGSSLTALAVTQIAKSAGTMVVGAAAPGQRFAAAKSRLTAAGAADVVEYTPKGAKAAAKLLADKRVALLANAVGGPQFNDFARQVGPDGTCVTFGAQHGFGITWSGGHHIFNGMTHRGFFAPRFLASLSYADRQKTFEAAIANVGSLQYPVAPVKTLEELTAGAWDSTYLEGGKKHIFTF